MMNQLPSGESHDWDYNKAHELPNPLKIFNIDIMADF